MVSRRSQNKHYANICSIFGRSTWVSSRVAHASTSFVERSDVNDVLSVSKATKLSAAAGDYVSLSIYVFFFFFFFFLEFFFSFLLSFLYFFLDFFLRHFFPVLLLPLLHGKQNIISVTTRTCHGVYRLVSSTFILRKVDAS